MKRGGEDGREREGAGTGRGPGDGGGAAAGSGVVWLARHGETEWNRTGRWQGRTDIPLSEIGRAQALALAERTRGRGVARVHSSHLARARETAEIVAGALGLPPPHLHAGLAERGFGCFEGLDAAECALRFPEAWALYRADRRRTPPGGEPQEEVVARMIAAMASVAGALGAGEAALVISHGGALRSFMAAVTGTAPAPIGNGVLFRATLAAGRFVSFDEV